MASFQEFAAKKVFGIPILYIIGAAVAILAVVAIKMRPSTSTAEDEVPPDAADVGKDAKDPYDEFETQGTVIVQPQAPNPEQANPGISTNQEWLTKGVAILTAKNKGSGTFIASALNKYLNGQDRSYDEDRLVNEVIDEIGLPPDGTDGGGVAGPKPSTKQFTGSGTHTVQGTGDNTASALAALYYNSSAQDRIDLIESANLTLGIGPYPTGAKVNVPAYHTPVYYTVPKDMTAAQYASQNGAISMAKLAALNNPKGGTYAPNYRLVKGTRLRVG